MLITQNDGLKGLQNGLVPALWYQWTMNGTRLGLYHSMENLGWTHNRNGSVSSFFSIAAGAISGAFGAFAASPFYLVIIASSLTNFSIIDKVLFLDKDTTSKPIEPNDCCGLPT